MQDPATLHERGKVKLVPDEQLERLMPLRVAIVDVKLTDGTHLTERVDDVRGTPRNPMTRDEIVAKARDLIAPVLGAAQGAALIEKLLNVDRVKNIGELRPLLQRA
jgi:2-methylcitrate dehydratase PrpD